MRQTIRPDWRVLALVGALLPAMAQAQQQTSPTPGSSGAEPVSTPSAKTAQPPPPKPASDGFTLQSESGDYRLRIGGYVHGDARFYADDAAGLGSDTFLLRRARPVLQGTLARRFDFYVMTDFGGGVAVVQDAYLDARVSPLLRVRVGKFKAPVGLERLQSATNLLFVERALPTSIAPNRDIGLQLHGEVAAGLLGWALAVQNGVADGASGDTDSNDGKDVAGRAFVQPFRKTAQALQGLGLGVAGQVGKQGAVTPTAYRSPGQLVFFSYSSGVTVDGTRSRLSPQGWFYAGPFGLLGEYVVSSSPLLRGAERGRIRNEAWQVAASFFLTGEKAGFQPVRPRQPLDPGHGGWGSLELVARAHRLSIGADAFTLGFADAAKSAHQATAWGVGLNWLLNRNVKYVLDYEQTSFRGGAASGDRPTEHALLLRAQVLF